MFPCVAHSRLQSTAYPRPRSQSIVSAKQGPTRPSQLKQRKPLNDVVMIPLGPPQPSQHRSQGSSGMQQGSRPPNGTTRTPYTNGTSTAPAQTNGTAMQVIDVASVTVTEQGLTATPVATDNAVSSPAQGAKNTFAGGMPAYYFTEDTSVTADIPMDTGFDWSAATYNKQLRSSKIWSLILSLRLQLFLLDKPWAYIGGMTPERRSARTRSLAAWVRETLLDLGPTFIKLGQLFSTRSDLFPVEFTSELSQLQDRVPAFSADKAVAIIEEDLGKPLSAAFKSFDRRPIAAASLGQVHRVLLLDGTDAVVKVQRPGLKALFDIDLETLEKVAEQIDRQDDSGRSDFRGIYKECATILYNEIDYIKEGRNADRFRRNFRGVAWVQVPRVYWESTSPRVLVSEYMPGIKITNIKKLQEAGIDVALIARRATESLLLQLLQHSLYHADPHPGNIAISPTGSIIYYDFGMVGEIKPNTRELLLDTFYAFFRKDAEGVVTALTGLGIIVPTGDRVSVRRAISFFIDNLNREVKEKEAVAVIGEDLFAIALDQPFRFPASFTFVLRAFSTLEGIGKTLDPRYSFVAVAQPYAQQLLAVQDQRAPMFTELQRQAQKMADATLAMPSRVQKIETFVGQVETGDLRLRVRVLEAERASRRAAVMQTVTLQSVGALGTVNLGLQLALAGQEAWAGVLFTGSGVLGVLVALGLRRVKRLDKFEQRIKG